MQLEERLDRIKVLEQPRILKNKLDVSKYPRTKTEKEELLKISCVGSKLSWNSPIYTYVKYKFFKKYWMEKGLWNICFTNPKKFPDPYDSLMYKVPVRMGKNFVSQELLLKDVFISCWTKCKESELHWNCYGRDSKSVCVVSTPRKIMQYIYDFRLRGSYNFFFTGNVVYKNLFDVERKIKYTTWDEYKEQDYCIEQLFLKTKEHVNEKEIRFVFYDATNDGEKKSKLWRTNTEYAKVKVDCNKVFDEIIINPSLKEEEVDFMIAEIKNNGFTKSVRKSRLYDNPHIYIDVAPSIGDKC